MSVEIAVVADYKMECELLRCGGPCSRLPCNRCYCTQFNKADKEFSRLHPRTWHKIWEDGELCDAHFSGLLASKTVRGNFARDFCDVMTLTLSRQGLMRIRCALLLPLTLFLTKGVAGQAPPRKAFGLLTNPAQAALRGTVTRRAWDAFHSSVPQLFPHSGSVLQFKRNFFLQLGLLPKVKFVEVDQDTSVRFPGMIGSP